MIITSNSSKPVTPPPLTAPIDISYTVKEPPNAMDELEAQLDSMDEDMIMVRAAAYFQSFMLIGMAGMVIILLVVFRTL